MRVVLSKHIVDLVSQATEENAGFPFRQDHCYRLLKNITHVYNLNRDKSDDGYVMLCAKYLQNISHEYKAYMDWMEQVNIVQISHSYQNSHPDVTKNYCKYYKIVTPPDDFMPNDREQLVQVNFKENKAIKVFSTSVKRTHGLAFMVKWLKQLTINERQAHNLNWQLFKEDKISPRYGYRMGEYHYEPYKIDPQRAYNARKDNIVTIGIKQFYMSRDKTSGRLHSNVTGLSSRIFPALRINEKPLVGYDIANSQPFLCSALINLLLSNEKVNGSSPNLHQSLTLQTPPTSFLSNPSFLSYLKHYLPIKPQSLLVMLENFLSEPDLAGVLDFQNLCITGNLYSEIARSVFGFEYINENKRRVKDLFFTLFFTKPRNNKGGIPKFKERYAGVHKIISKIKESSTDANFFPVLLQSLESYYIIERVCKRMNKENPKAPIYTKHDSVYTTVEYLDKLRLVMEEEALQLFGMVPKLNQN